jgi:hypothetical protein
MKFSSVLSAVAVAGAMVASPAFAITPSADGGAPDDHSPLTSDETPRPPAQETIEGRITALERESGRFVLDTRVGPVSLVTSPDELSGVEVGDFVEVSLVSNDRP